LFLTHQYLRGFPTQFCQWLDFVEKMICSCLAGLHIDFRSLKADFG
jgi:hypothetical protein